MYAINREAYDALSAVDKKAADEAFVALNRIAEANPLVRYYPHPKQVRFHSFKGAYGLHIKAFFGGNRSGKTTAGILDDIIQAGSMRRA